MTIIFDPDEALKYHYDFDTICATLNSDLKIAIAGQDDMANQIWRQRQLFGIWRNYIETYSLLRAERYYDAWCLIEQTLIDCKYLLQNFPEDKDSIEFVRKHIMTLQSLFPYRLFISTVMKVKKEICSICNSEISPWNNCGHTPGIVYNGEICSKIVTDLEIIGADIVFNPEHKCAVLFIQDNDGNQIDNYDYTLLKQLIQYWQTPFQNWTVTKETRYVTPPSGLKDSDLCPCHRSFKTYGECCKKYSGICIYHYTIKP